MSATHEVQDLQAVDGSTIRVVVGSTIRVTAGFIKLAEVAVRAYRLLKNGAVGPIFF